MVAGDKRRSAENLEVKTLDYYLEICLRSDNTRDRCLVSLLFLSGRRIGELIELRKSDLIFTREFLTVVTYNEKTFRYTNIGNYKLEREGNYLQYYKDEKGKTYTIPRSLRYYPEIHIDISRSTPAYKMLGKFIEEHLASLIEKDWIFKKFRGKGHIHSGMAYRIVTYLDPQIWLHWFRHQRLTNVYNIAKAKSKNPMDILEIVHAFSKHKTFDTTRNYIKGIELREIKKEI